MLFSDVKYHISSSLPTERSNELKSVLDANGAELVSVEEASHVISDTPSYEGHEAASPTVRVVMVSRLSSRPFCTLT